MFKDKYGIEIKVGDWVQLISMTGMEFSSEHSAKIYSVKEIKTKYNLGSATLYELQAAESSFAVSSSNLFIVKIFFPYK